MTRLIKIACVGDSVVYGYGVLENRQEQVWTTLLEQLLNRRAEQACEGKRTHESGRLRYLTQDVVYEVGNFGLNGQSVMAGAFVPYAQIDSPLYKQMCAWKPDAFFLHVGGNDSHDDIWDPKTFKREYRRLAEDLTGMAGREHVCLMSPPLARDEAGAQRMRKYSLNNDVIREVINPFIAQTAADLGTACIELAPMLRTMPSLYENCPPLYYDEIHPNEAGNELIADAAYTIACDWTFD